MTDLLGQLGITYDRPGYTLAAEYQVDRQAWLIVAHVQRPDVNDPNSVVPVVVRRFLDVRELREERHHVLHVVRGLLRELERHEIDEWLKVDGKCAFDPHPELRGPS